VPEGLSTVRRHKDLPAIPRDSGILPGDGGGRRERATRQCGVAHLVRPCNALTSRSPLPCDLFKDPCGVGTVCLFPPPLLRPL
jgi:hypothetical protein